MLFVDFLYVLKNNFMTYLVVGDANSMHIFNYVKNVLIPLGYQIHLLTLSSRLVREEYSQFYVNNDVVLHSIAGNYGKDLKNSSLKDRIRNFWYKYKLFDEFENIDICHIQSVYKTSIFFYLLKRKKFKYLIASYWGGDIEDTTSYVVKIRKFCFSFANIITVTTQKTYNEFIGIYGSLFTDKLLITRMATEGLDCINRVFHQNSIVACKEDLDIPLDKIIITCGYSAYADQHQDLALERISLLPSDLKKNLCVIVPLQYGRFDVDYINKIVALSKTIGCECIILEKYYSFEESAKLTIATDIYLHLRETDAFSNSLKEHVFAGSKIIIGRWLRYYELDEMQAKVNYISSFDELLPVLEKILREVLYSNAKKELFYPIYDKYSQNAIKEQWKNILKCFNN